MLQTLYLVLDITRYLSIYEVFMQKNFSYIDWNEISKPSEILYPIKQKCFFISK